MKKGIYSVKVEMDESSRTRQASCDCPAGVDGRCNHLAATLFMLESLDYNENKENSVLLSQEQLPNIPCTSKLCTWNVPKRAEKIKKLEEETGMKTGLSFILQVNKNYPHQVKPAPVMWSYLVQDGCWSPRTNLFHYLWRR